MRHINSQVFALLVAVAPISSCAPDGTAAVDPLPSGTDIPVTLISTTYVPLAGLPRLEITGLVGEIEVVWDVESQPCVSAHLTGTQNSRVLQIQIRRSPDMTLLACIDTLFGTRYVLHAGPLAAGTYDVRVLDQEVGAPLREAGRRSVVVTDFFHGLNGTAGRGP